MNSWKLLVPTVMVLCFIDLSYECSSSGGKRPHDVDPNRGRRDIYNNNNIVKAERVERPMGGALGTLGVKHSGVRVTLEDGSQQLVYNGKGYGDSGKNVVTDVKNMRKDWKVAAEKKRGGA